MHETAITVKGPPVTIPGYELLQEVGRGGMGEVHQATQLSLGRSVAVKLLKAELSTDPQFVGRFDKEAAALAQLRHPHIVSIVDRGKSGDTYYLVMEFVDGPSLREKMREPGFGVRQALLTMLLVTRAVEYAHGRGVVHRDLKPENILFDEQAGGIPKVTDFGLAGLDDSFGPQKHLTQTHVAMGTAAYMAPEQSVDAKSAGPRADLYSLGVMFYEALTGELPVGSFAPPSTRKPGLDKRLDAIIARCLRPTPDERYASATALLADLEKVAQVSTSFIRPNTETTPQRLLRRSRELARKVGRAAAAAVVIFALAVVGVVFLRRNAQDTQVASGLELMSDFGLKAALTTPGRFDRATRTVTLGNGPDTIGLMALGRQPTLEDGAVAFGATTRGAPTGRVVLDADVTGSGLLFSAVVDTEATEPSSLEPLWELFRGRRPAARSALLLLGENGRYVALVVSSGGEEPTLEWALGPDKRGLMQAPLPIKRLGQPLALRMDPETGELFAVSGVGRDARVLGDGLWVGPYWRQLLGESPRPALGCLQGRCVFRDVVVQGLELPSGLSPPAFPAENMLPDEPEPAPTPALAPKPRPKPTRKPAGKPKRR